MTYFDPNKLERKLTSLNNNIPLSKEEFSIMKVLYGLSCRYGGVVSKTAPELAKNLSGLKDSVHISSDMVYHYLRKLQAANIIKITKCGRRNCYNLSGLSSSHIPPLLSSYRLLRYTLSILRILRTLRLIKTIASFSLVRLNIIIPLHSSHRYARLDANKARHDRHLPKAS